jgi:glycosyltransferase involved in cell wall biosynthesis
MRILYVCSTDLSGETGSPGSVRHVMEVAENLLALGHDITLIAPGYAPYPHPTLVPIEYVPIVRRRFFRTLTHEALTPLYMLRRFLKHRPGAVYWRQAYLTFWPVLLARLFGVPIVTEVNGLTLDEVESENLSALRKRAILLFERFNYTFSTRLVCVAPAIRDRIAAHYGISNDRALVVLNGVNAERMPVMETREAKKALGWDTDALHIGFVGHLFPWDGVETLIEAAPRVLAEVPEARFVVIGQGKWGEHLPCLARDRGLADRFLFTGLVPWELLYTYINAMDVATAPYSKAINTQSGRSSLKLLEYFACQKPVVASATSVIPEVVDLTEKGLGLVAPPEDPAALAQALVKLLTNPALRASLGAGGRDYVLKERSWRHVAARVADIVREAAE